MFSSETIVDSFFIDVTVQRKA